MIYKREVSGFLVLKLIVASVLVLLTIAFLGSDFRYVQGLGGENGQTGQDGLSEAHHLYLPVVMTPLTHVSLESVASGFDFITDITHGGDDRLFVAEKDGRIRILNQNGTIEPEDFLDITGQVDNSAFTTGLLGLAMHPNFDQNGYFYIYYINLQLQTVISRFNVSEADLNLADPDSELVLFTIDQPTDQHQAGALQFGPLDGYLYIASGDGGVGLVNSQNAQDLNSKLGKILRIDVDNGSPYVIPSDNPFVGDADVQEEIWAYGLRNPWRFSFDSLTGDMFIGDVGNLLYEELNFQDASSEGGENYGWPCYEGVVVFASEHCDSIVDYDFPIHTYSQGEGCASITGGYVYRGEKYPAMQGFYLFTDMCFRRIWGASRDLDENWTFLDLGHFSFAPWTTFGEGSDGELYVASFNHDTIYHIVPGQP